MPDGMTREQALNRARGLLNRSMTNDDGARWATAELRELGTEYSFTGDDVLRHAQMSQTSHVPYVRPTPRYDKPLLTEYAPTYEPYGDEVLERARSLQHRSFYDDDTGRAALVELQELSRKHGFTDGDLWEYHTSTDVPTRWPAPQPVHLPTDLQATIADYKDSSSPQPGADRSARSRQRKMVTEGGVATYVQPTYVRRGGRGRRNMRGG